MSQFLTGICEADPAEVKAKVAVSRGNTFLSAKRTFSCTGLFQNAITHPDEDRLLAELLTVHHFSLTPLFYGIWSKNLCMHHDIGHHVHMAARDISASGQHAQCGKDYQIYARPVSVP